MKNLARTVGLLIPTTLACLAYAAPPDGAEAGNRPPPFEAHGSPSIASNALYLVHDRLGLNAEQEALWQAFEGKVTAYTALLYQAVPVQPSANEPTTKQIGKLVNQQQNRLAALEDIELAAKPLYAALSESQQLIANQFLLSSIPLANGAYFGARPGESGKPERIEGAPRQRGSGMGGRGRPGS